MAKLQLGVSIVPSALDVHTAQLPNTNANGAFANDHFWCPSSAAARSKTAEVRIAPAGGGDFGWCGIVSFNRGSPHHQTDGPKTVLDHEISRTEVKRETTST